ncbi:hypothetical protein LCGC14_1317500 [marine sediment metagenome]|uniref:Uncharacterized protein n=1 Tax=marine sediment metagenome TaxID=412755 RepID=A0A0F9KKZ7_9ZZZZ
MNKQHPLSYLKSRQLKVLPNLERMKLIVKVTFLRWR